ncbi:MAG: UDP-2,4-diacetamido-2,4,6-trideoxy-beta-L-altropyranose hydrolase, partial [Sphingobacteriales bacterium]
MNKPKIIFRADGNSQIGLGHLIRALSMVSMLKNDYDCAFAIQEPTDAIKNIILSECDEIIELPTTNDLLPEAQFLAILEADCYVLDGYHFDLPYMQVLKNAFKKLVFIDDIFNKQFVADVVINPAGGIDENKYQIEPNTKLFTGPQYAILREAFLEASIYEKEVKSQPENFLVCLGGADPENKTIEVVNRLLEI